MASLIEGIRDFLRDHIAGDQTLGDPPVPGKISDLNDLRNKLDSIQVSTDKNGLTDWLDTLKRTIGDPGLRETLLVRALQLKLPRLTEALVLAGLIKVLFDEQTHRAHTFTIGWDQLDAFLRDPGQALLVSLLSRIQKIEDLKAAQAMSGLWLTSPKKLLLLEYAEQGFGSLPNAQPGGAVDLIELVADLINSPLKLAFPITLPLTIDELKSKALAGKTLTNNYIAISGPDSELGLNKLDGFGFEIRVSDAVSANYAKDIGDGLSFTLSAAGSGDRTYKLVMKNGAFERAVDANSTAALDAGIAFKPAGGKVVIGPADGPRLEIGPAGLALRLQPDKPPGSPLFTLNASLESVAFFFTTESLGQLAKLAPLPKEVRFESKLAVSYVQGQGLQGSGGAVSALPPLSTAFTVPLNLKLGGSSAGLAIERIKVEIAVKLGDQGSLRSKVSLRFGATGNFGPVTISADGMGASFGNWDVGPLGLMKPTAIGVSLKAGPVSGGGFLAQTGDDEYAGGLALKVLGIGVGAFALFGQAQGAPSFVGILGIRLPLPGVQIGFGFAITGVGGVVGINRRVDTDVLREQLASGASADILFCADPSKNALGVISQLPRLFPPKRGTFLIGPTFQISWLELLKLDLGIFIELPVPNQIFMAGSARLVIGTEAAALAYFRMDFVGGVDLVKSLVYFDAALVNSHVMQVFKISGGVALRLAYGDNGYFLFSVGGFHPSFNPGGLELPKLARVGTCASIDIAWFKLENYFALTSNTFQIGASVEAGLEIGPISAHGWIRFDALVQFEPFYFVAEIDAGFDVEVFGVELCNVRVQGKMSGPGPLVVEARASVRVLLAKVSESVTVRLGSGPASVPRAVDIVLEIAKEFAKPENTRGDGQDNSVVFRNNRDTVVDNATVVQAIGDIVWEQKRAPFGLELQKFEGVPLSGIHRMAISSNDADEEAEQDWFGMGTYLNLSSSEALNNSRFTQAQSGIRIRLKDLIEGNVVPCQVMLELVKLPKRSRSIPFPAASYMSAAMAQMQHERAGIAAIKPGDARIKAVQEKWKVVRAVGETRGLSSAQAFLAQRGGGGLAQPATARAVSLGGVF